MRLQDRIELWVEDFSFVKITQALEYIFYAEQLRWFLFVPVIFGSGIYFYFGLTFEPNFIWSALLILAVIVALICLGLVFGFSHLWILFSVASVVFTLGFARAVWRAHSVAAPVLESKIEGQVKATIKEISITRSRKTQTWIIEPSYIAGDVDIKGVSKLPKYIRLKVKPFKGREIFRTGDVIEVKALLFPPPRRVLPRGFDFTRSFWFKQLGATGVALTPARLLHKGESSFSAWLDNTRNQIATSIDKTLKSASAAGIAAALIVGKRELIPKKIEARLRDTGLAHILAISGLHMAAFAGTIYFVVRALLALVGLFVLHYPIKKWAMIPALSAGVVYLFLSGGAVSTQRAFIMFAVVALAVLRGVSVITLRNLAIAALLVLCLFPESLLEASFQLSFAASLAIVALYERIDFSWFQRTARDDKIVLLRRRLFLSALTLLFTSLAAWAATAPFALFHFNRLGFAPALAANLSVLPIFTLWTMPAVVAALPALLLGWEKPVLLYLGESIEVIIKIIGLIVERVGVAKIVLAPPDFILTLYVIGGLWLCLWHQAWRYLGGGVLALAFVLSLALTREQADIIVSENVIATRGAARSNASRDNENLLYSSAPAAWLVGQWLRADGDERSAWQVYDRKKFPCSKGLCITQAQGKKIIFARRSVACEQKADVFIGETCVGTQLTIRPQALREHGTHLIYFRDSFGDSFGVEHAPKEYRLWSNTRGTSQPSDLER